MTNENDENAIAASTRLTRDKANSSTSQEPTGLAKKPLQTKKAAAGSTATNTTAAAAAKTRKRAALGDVSNVPKNENAQPKNGKKVGVTTAGMRAGLTSKSTSAAQSGGVQKITRTNTSRSVLGARDTNKREAAPVEHKRPGPGSGALSDKKPRQTATGKTVRKHRVTPATTSTEQAPRRKVTAPATTSTTITETVPEVEEETENAPVQTKAKPKPKTEKTEKAEKAEKAVVESVKESVKENVEVVEPEKAKATEEVAEPEDEVLDLDTQDLLDPIMTAEYVGDIFEYLKEIEVQTMPNPRYMDHQEELDWRMRGILVDWLIEVHARFRLLPETLFVTVNIVDRFLSAEVVALSRLQLVGVTAIFIASKYEEVLPPHVAHFSSLADEAFTQNEILDAERHLLATLNYDLSYPNPMNFLRRISKADTYDVRTRTMGKYLIEISLVDHRFLCYKQSHIAAAAMYMARLICARGPWVSWLQPCVSSSHYFLTDFSSSTQPWLIIPVTQRKNCGQSSN